MSLMDQQVYIVGREPDPSQPRIVLKDPSISRIHASLTKGSDGRYLLKDLKSSNGTFVRDQGGWRRVESASLFVQDEARFGAYVTTVANLVKESIHDAQSVRLERNVETGEI